jgi:hypothetical protein
LSNPTADQRRQVLIIGVVTLGKTVAAVLAALSRPPADESVHRSVRRWGWLDGLSWLSGTTSPWFLAAMALLMLLGWRCRTFLLTAAATLLTGYLLGWVLAQSVGRERPLESAMSGTESFPSLSLLMLTVLAGLAPMALKSLTRSRLVTRGPSAALGLVVIGTALVEVHQGARWPLDVVASMLIGIGLIAGARIVLEEPAKHPWCGDCLWRRRATGERPVGPIVVAVAPRRARQLHRLTLLWVAGLVAAYGVLALTGGLPRSPESGVMGTGLEVPLQWVLLVLIVSGVLLARRWHVAGAIVVAVAASLLGYASSLQYPAPVAALVAIGAWAPAVLLWLEWHRSTTLRAAFAAAIATSVVLGGVVAAAATTYSQYWGPTHPRSVTAALDTSIVEWMWSGGVTSTSGNVRLRTADEADRVRVVASEHADLSRPTRTAEVRPDQDRVSNVHLTCGRSAAAAD